ncbi:hypothetical protein J6590_053957 [Homalodisca vitripennis]|nr:hypothetical protein J6590_053957 [Homalodisca vitripennis]
MFCFIELCSRTGGSPSPSPYHPFPPSPITGCSLQPPEPTKLTASTTASSGNFPGRCAERVRGVISLSPATARCLHPQVVILIPSRPLSCRAGNLLQGRVQSSCHPRQLPVNQFT